MRLYQRDFLCDKYTLNAASILSKQTLKIANRFIVYIERLILLLYFIYILFILL